MDTLTSRIRFRLVLSTAALAAAFVVATLRPDAAQADAASTPGHCSFKLKNQWVGPLRACREPASAEQCAGIGGTDENSEAQWAAGQCPTASLVGSCRTPDWTLHYYEGEAGGLEMGCGFQGGTWTTAAR